MNILAIGNSFSQDATHYLHQIARAGGEPSLNVVDLCIGGCPLSRHYRNMLGNKKDYMLEYNGSFTGFYTTLEEGLLSREWDVITIQQVSHLAPYYDSFQPYLNELTAYIRKMAPKAKLYLQETWAYEQGCERLYSVVRMETREQMYAALHAAYAQAARDCGADGIIPSGTLMEALTVAGIEKVHRDSYHVALGVSRYALALLWYRVLTGRDVTENPFTDTDVPMSEEERRIALSCVADLKL